MAACFSDARSCDEAKPRPRHRTRVYITNDSSNGVHNGDGPGAHIPHTPHATKTLTNSEACPGPRPGPLSLPHVEDTMDTSMTERVARESSSSLESGSSQDTLDRPRLVGILKSPGAGVTLVSNIDQTVTSSLSGKRRHFRKHVEFLDKQEGRQLDVAVRYF